jgi:hypothetical protein
VMIASVTGGLTGTLLISFYVGMPDL